MEKLYFPILKAKDGELSAIKGLPSNIKDVITPIFQLTNPNQQRNKPLRLIDKKHISETASKIKDCTYRLPYILDTSYVKLETVLEELLISTLTSHDLFYRPDFYPLVNINCNSKFYQSCLGAGYTPKKVCLKLNWQNTLNPDIEEQLQNILDSMGVEEEKIILLIDLEDVSDTDVDKAITHLATFFQNINSAFRFDTLILGAGAFPFLLAGMTPWQLKYIERRDWKLYNKVRSLVNSIKYGDYGINNPKFSESAGFSGPSNIRYTMNGYFAVVRGVKPDIIEDDETNKDQYKKLSKMIVENDFYAGTGYSWGDDHIYNCTQPTHAKVGNATTWRKAGTSHHIVHVTDSLSRLL